MATTTPSQPQSPADRPLRELRGVVERITYQNPENGYTVARPAPERPEGEAEVARGDDGLVTVVGALAAPTPGGASLAKGWRRRDACGLVQGIRPVNAAPIGGMVGEATVGEATFEVTDADPVD